MKGLKKNYRDVFSKCLRKYGLSSWRLLSGLFMVIVIFFGLIFLIDPSVFSASIISNQILDSENKSFTEISDELAGVLPNSPLYGFRNYFKFSKTLNEEDITLLFAKLIKADKKGEKELVNDLYIEFLQSIDGLELEKQEDFLNYLIEQLKYVPIENSSFCYIYDVFSLAGKEDFWVNQLVLYSYQKDIRLIEKVKIVFEKLEEKKKWRQFILEKNLIFGLRKIKQNVKESQEITSGEILHSSGESWIKSNEIWNSL